MGSANHVVVCGVRRFKDCYCLLRISGFGLGFADEQVLPFQSASLKAYSFLLEGVLCVSVSR